MYVEDRVIDWAWEYNADKFTWSHSNKGHKRGCSMRFGNLLVSIQWSDYNYCDNYVLSAFHRPNPDPHNGKPYPSRTAEVAVFFGGRYQTFGKGMLYSCMIRFPDGDTVFPYAEQGEIEEILRVCHMYSENGHDCGCMVCNRPEDIDRIVEEIID